MFGGDILPKQRGYDGTWISAKIRVKANGGEEGKVYTAPVVLIRLKNVLCCGMYLTSRQDTVDTFEKRINSLYARKRRLYLKLLVALSGMLNTVSSKDRLSIASEQWT